jgi:ribosome biogenesis GTPase
MDTKLKTNDALSLDDHGQFLEGVVYKKTIGSYAVQTNGQVTHCNLAPRLRARHIDTVVVGDLVRYQPASGNIIEVLPRRNQVSRRSAVPMPTAHAFEQVMAANVDQVAAVIAAAEPAPKWNLLDRYLVSAEWASIPALICLTKLDLAQCAGGQIAEQIHQAAQVYTRIGYQVALTSAVNGQGLEALRLELQGKVSVLVGKSGVGKTSLLNALQPGLGLRITQVSQATGKGRHTTTHQEMFPLDFGGVLIDTPGLREFGLWEVDGRDLAHLFPEMRPFIGRCRFRLDCQHDEETGCAVRQAVLDGQIDPRRYQSYIKLKDDT